jgi:hypothetical protein
MPDRLHLCLLISLVAGFVDPAAGLSQVWLDLEVGRSSHDLVASQLSSDDLIVSLRYAGTPWIAVSGAAPLAGSGGPWGAAAVGGDWFRDLTGPLSIGVAATGQIYGFGAGSEERTGSDWGLVTGAAPVLRLDRGSGYAEVSSGPILSWGDASADGDLRRHHSSVAAAGLTIRSASTIEAVARYLRADGRGYPFVGAGFSHSLTFGGLWGRGGIWTDLPEDGSEWSAGAFWSASPRFEVYGSFQQQALDPIFRIAPRQNWTLGLSYALRPAASNESIGLPLAMAATASSFRIAGDDVSSRPSIAADFTGWTPVPMEQDGSFWVATFELAPGLYRYSFVDANGAWFLPDSVVHRVPDGFGGENGVIVVQ